MKHVRIRIYGKVQGVFFRASTRDKANELGIAGFVQNESDGSVYLEAEGEEDRLERFVEWCRKGPDRAMVERMEDIPGKWIGFEVFEVRR